MTDTDPTSTGPGSDADSGGGPVVVDSGAVDPAVANLLTCWDSLDALFASLGDADWDTPSLCPDWTVRQTLVHLASIEAMLAGKGARSFGENLPFGEALAAAEEFEALQPAELLERWTAITAIRRDELTAMTADDLAHPSVTPVGQATYGRFMAVRVFDCWVHEQDVRVPLGRPGHEGGSAAEMAVDEIAGSLGYIVGKKIGLGDGQSITFELTGPVTRTMHVAVDGRATVVDELDDPTVTLTTDSTTFALLACGRIDPQGPIDDGRVRWSGDTEIGDRAARSLRFTM
jgi:uncharacterized protein (TIGR03083 family)